MTIPDPSSLTGDPGFRKMTHFEVEYRVFEIACRAGERERQIIMMRFFQNDAGSDRHMRSASRDACVTPVPKRCWNSDPA